MIAISTRRLLPALVAAATLAVLGGFAATPLGRAERSRRPRRAGHQFDESTGPNRSA